MMRFFTDEDFRHDVLRGVLRLLPETDVVTAQQVSLTSVDDTVLLAWAAQDNRVLLTHDRNTMNGFALDRVRASLPMPEVVSVRRLSPILVLISDLVYLVQAGNDADFRNQVIYVPL